LYLLVYACLFNNIQQCLEARLAVAHIKLFCRPAVRPPCQALLVLVKRSPPDGRKLLVIGTSSRSEICHANAPSSCLVMIAALISAFWSDSGQGDACTRMCLQGLCCGEGGAVFRPISASCLYKTEQRIQAL
jgi:hypothetical protein